MRGSGRTRLGGSYEEREKFERTNRTGRLLVSPLFSESDEDDNDSEGEREVNGFDAIRKQAKSDTMDLKFIKLSQTQLELLVSTLGKSNTVSSLDLWACGLTYKVIPYVSSALSLCPTITTVDIGSNTIGDIGVQALLSSLPYWVKNLSMSKTNLTDDAGPTIANFLASPSCHLEVLDLRSNSLGDKAARNIADALKNNESLTKLILFHNNIGNSGGFALADAVKQCPTLKCIDLRMNLISSNRLASMNNIKISGSEIMSPVVGHQKYDTEDVLKNSTNTNIRDTNVLNNRTGNRNGSSGNPSVLNRSISNENRRNEMLQQFQKHSAHATGPLFSNKFRYAMNAQSSLSSRAENYYNSLNNRKIQIQIQKQNAEQDDFYDTGLGSAYLDRFYEKKNTENYIREKQFHQYTGNDRGGQEDVLQRDFYRRPIDAQVPFYGQYSNGKENISISQHFGDLGMEPRGSGIDIRERSLYDYSSINERKSSYEINVNRRLNGNNASNVINNNDKVPGYNEVKDVYVRSSKQNESIKPSLTSSNEYYNDNALSPLDLNIGTNNMVKENNSYSLQAKNYIYASVQQSTKDANAMKTNDIDQTNTINVVKSNYINTSNEDNNNDSEPEYNEPVNFTYLTPKKLKRTNNIQEQGKSASQNNNNTNVIQETKNKNDIPKNSITRNPLISGYGSLSATPSLYSIQLIPYEPGRNQSSDTMSENINSQTGSVVINQQMAMIPETSESKSNIKTSATRENIEKYRNYKEESPIKNNPMNDNDYFPEINTPEIYNNAASIKNINTNVFASDIIAEYNDNNRCINEYNRNSAIDQELADELHNLNNRNINTNENTNTHTHNNNTPRKNKNVNMDDSNNTTPIVNNTNVSANKNMNNTKNEKEKNMLNTPDEDDDNEEDIQLSVARAKEVTKGIYEKLKKNNNSIISSSPSPNVSAVNSGNIIGSTVLMNRDMNNSVPVSDQRSAFNAEFSSPKMSPLSDREKYYNASLNGSPLMYQPQISQRTTKQGEQQDTLTSIVNQLNINNLGGNVGNLQNENRNITMKKHDSSNSMRDPGFTYTMNDSIYNSDEVSRREAIVDMREKILMTLTNKLSKKRKENNNEIMGMIKQNMDKKHGNRSQQRSQSTYYNSTYTSSSDNRSFRNNSISPSYSNNTSISSLTNDQRLIQLTQRVNNLSELHERRQRRLREKEKSLEQLNEKLAKEYEVVRAAKKILKLTASIPEGQEPNINALGTGDL